MSSTSVNETAGKANCIPCSTMDSSFLLPKDVVQSKLQSTLPLWTLAFEQSQDADDLSSYDVLTRTFVAKNFQAAMDAINAMGVIAERESHHPDFHLTNYRNVKIVVWTHTLKGITENDLTLAALLDEVEIQCSPKWLKAHPYAERTERD